jgi:hypothetical protein
MRLGPECGCRRGAGREHAALGAAAGAAQQHPLGERPDQMDVAGRVLGENLFQPQIHTFEALVADRQNAGMDKDGA